MSRAFRAAVVCVLALLPFVCDVAAQESRVGLVSFRRVAIPDDVPAHLCTAIAQDRSGLLWFGTQGGLVRYDGYEFRVYRSNPDDASTLAGNYVRTLLSASDGRLWVGTFSGGLSVFDPRTETFRRYRHVATDAASLSYDRVEGLAEDRDGRIWIATTAGLDRLDPKRGRFEHFRHLASDATSVADDRVRGLLVDRRGQLWVGSRDGLQVRRNDANGFERIAPELAGQYVTRLYEDRRGRIWVGTEEHGAAVIDPATVSMHRIAPRPADPNGLSHYWVYGFAEGPGEEIWIATFGGGVDVLDARTLAVVDRLHADPVLPDTIGADRVGAVFRDRAGSMWVGTWGEGLARHDPRTRAFRSLRFSPGRTDGLTHPAAVRALETSDGNILVGTNGNGIDVFDASLHRIGNHVLPDQAITCLAQSPDGTLWVATLHSSLHFRRPGASRFEAVPPNRLPGGPIRTIAFARDGMVWGGAAEGMVKLDPRTLLSRVFRTWPGAAQSSPAIEAIVIAADETLWVGTDNGLYSFDPRTERATRIAKDPSRADGLPDNWVPDLLLARDGRLWVGTAGGAAVMTGWDGHVARFESIARKLGRPPSPAEALVEDDQGMIWIGPRLRIDPKRDSKQWTARELGPSDGIPFRNFFIASRTRTRDGRLLFGSPEGLLVVEPRMLKGDDASSTVVPTALRIEGRSRAGAASLSSIALSQTERSFTIDVSALEFIAPQRLVYRHRLEGLDEEWTVTDAGERSLTYSRVPPGEYALRVGVMGLDGHWSSHELRMPVTVAPALYQTRWFRALLLLAIATALYAAYRLRVRQLRARERHLESLVQRRTGELAEKNEQLQQASLTDPLTGLRNRRYLEQTIGADLEIAARGAGRDLVFVMIDLDHFKSVNDQYGHAAGDAVLVQLAHVLRSAFRTSDSIVRWGGEEFLVVVRFVDRSCAADLAEKLRRAVESHAFALPDGATIHRTCSIGFATWPFSPHEPRALGWERIVDLADGALYLAKRARRNAWAGVLAGESGVPARAAEEFRESPERAVADRVVTLEASFAIE